MFFATLLVLAGWIFTGHRTFSADSPRRAENRVFMRQKLAWSQGVLEGLTLEQFNLVSKNALLMRDMTQSNGWFAVKHQDYMTLTTNYYKSVDKLYLAAVDKNLNAATEAYTAVVKNCVECHRLVRLDQRKIGGSEAK